MKKVKNEALLLKEALRVGKIYAEKRSAAQFEDTDSLHDKLTFIYRLLVHDKLIQPVPPDQESELMIKHKLALWISKQLPEDHPLLK